METKSVRGGHPFVRVAQTLVVYILFRLTVPFAGRAVEGTLPLLGLDGGASGPLGPLALVSILLISFGVPFCLFACWHYRQS